MVLKHGYTKDESYSVSIDEKKKFHVRSLVACNSRISLMQTAKEPLAWYK